MQILKKDIRKDILFVAKSEFLAYGFKETSMRTIAKKANVSLGNIYNYFKNKDEIFKEILIIPITQIEKTYKIWNNDYFFDLNNIMNQRINKLKLLYSIRFITQYRDELNLLLFKSYGSSLYNYKDKWIEESTKSSLEWVKKFNEKYNKNVKASSFFIHYLNSSFVNFISEILMHQIKKEDLEKYLKEYFSFYSKGWIDLIK